MTNKEMLGLLGTETKFNKARRIISGTSGLIEQSIVRGASPVEIRKLEFEAVEKILALWGIDATKE